MRDTPADAPPWGERGDFVRATITLPPALYAQVLEESTRRKVARSRDGSVSSIVRDALNEYLSARRGGERA